MKLCLLEVSQSAFDGKNSIMITLVYRGSIGVSDWLILAHENFNPSSNQLGTTYGLLLRYVIRMEFFWPSLTCDGCVLKIYGLLTKFEVKMAGYWPSSSFACLWTKTKSRSINSQKRIIIIWLSGKCFLRDTTGSPEWAR